MPVLPSLARPCAKELPGLAFADAFDFGRVQRIDLGTTLAMVLMAHLDGEITQGGEELLELRPMLDLAVDVTDHPAEPGAQELELPASPLELVCMAVAPDHDGGTLGHPQIVAREECGSG